MTDASEALSATPQARARLRGLIVPAIATLAATAFLVSLGNWQIRRLHYKTELAEHVTARLKMPPIALPPPSAWSALDPEVADYTPVRLSGHFINDREFHVFATILEPKGPLSGVGWFVFTPFVEDNGTEVIVNRGFVPDADREASTRPAGQIDGPVTVTGLLRRPEGSNLFTPANDLVRNRWFTRDPVAMAKVLGLPATRTLPFYVDADARATPKGGLPQAGETVIDFSNNHLGYAITWYGLALTALGVFAAVAWRRIAGPTPVRTPRTSGSSGA